MKKKTNNHAAVPVKIDELKKHYPEIASSLESAENSTEFNNKGLVLMKNDMLLYPTIRNYVIVRMQKRKEAFIKQWQNEFETLPKFVLNAPDEEDIQKAEKAFESTRSSYSFWLESGQPNEIRAMFTDGDVVVSVGLSAVYPKRTVDAVISLFEELSLAATIYYECVNHAWTTDSIYF
jgi:spermidine/putrescine-binding protein